MGELDKDTVIKVIHTWINNDVSKEQISAVFWGIMMSDMDERVNEIIKEMREEYYKQRKEIDGK